MRVLKGGNKYCTKLEPFSKYPRNFKYFLDFWPAFVCNFTKLDRKWKKYCSFKLIVTTNNSLQ